MERGNFRVTSPGKQLTWALQVYEESKDNTTKNSKNRKSKKSVKSEDVDEGSCDELEGKDEEEADDVIAMYFKRYDLDKRCATKNAILLQHHTCCFCSGTINSKEELAQLCMNLVFALSVKIDLSQLDGYSTA